MKADTYAAQTALYNEILPPGGANRLTDNNRRNAGIVRFRRLCQPIVPKMPLCKAWPSPWAGPRHRHQSHSSGAKLGEDPLPPLNALALE